MVAAQPPPQEAYGLVQPFVCAMATKAWSSFPNTDGDWIPAQSHFGFAVLLLLLFFFFPLQLDLFSY